MSNFDISGAVMDWKPLSGPVPILGKVQLDRNRLRLVPTKPIPLDGIKVAIETLRTYDMLQDEHVTVCKYN